MSDPRAPPTQQAMLAPLALLAPLVLPTSLAPLALLAPLAPPAPPAALAPPPPLARHIKCMVGTGWSSRLPKYYECTCMISPNQSLPPPAMAGWNDDNWQGTGWNGRGRLQWNDRATCETNMSRNELKCTCFQIKKAFEMVVWAEGQYRRLP